MEYNIKLNTSTQMYWQSPSVVDNKKLIISFISPCPCLGKSTISRVLAELLQGVWINQDECMGRRNYLAFIESTLRSRKIAIADKTNATEVQRNDLRSFDAGIIWIYMKPENHENLTEVAFSRLKNRSHHHKNLIYSDSSRGIIMSFIKSFEPPTKAERSDKFIEVDINGAPLLIVSSILAKLQEMQIIQSIPTNKKIEIAVRNSLNYEKSL